MSWLLWGVLICAGLAVGAVAMWIIKPRPGWFPAPTTFAEGQRALYGWLMCGAGMFCGLGGLASFLVFWLGAFPPETLETRLRYMALSAGGFHIGMIAVIFGLMVGGPVGRFKVKVGDNEAEAEARPEAAGPRGDAQ